MSEVKVQLNPPGVKYVQTAAGAPRAERGEVAGVSTSSARGAEASEPSGSEETHLGVVESGERGELVPKALEQNVRVRQP